MDRLVEVLKAAEAAVDRSGISEDLRVAGFECAVRVLSMEDEREYSHHVRDTAHATTNSVPVPLSKGHDQLAIRAKEYEVDLEALHELFMVGEGDEVILTLARQSISVGIKGGLQDIALVLCFVRQGMGFEDFTPQDKLAAAAEYYHVRDTNFSKHLKSMGAWFQSQPLNGSKRAFRLKRAGWLEAAKVLTRMIEF